MKYNIHWKVYSKTSPLCYFIIFFIFLFCTINCSRDYILLLWIFEMNTDFNKWVHEQCDTAKYIVLNVAFKTHYFHYRNLCLPSTKMHVLLDYLHEKKKHLQQVHYRKGLFCTLGAALFKPRAQHLFSKGWVFDFDREGHNYPLTGGSQSPPLPQKMYLVYLTLFIKMKH